MSIHLIIPDGHAHADFDNRRFSLIGQLIMEVMPDVIINLGDLADMPSLCSYERGTGKFEGRRYWKDIEANKEANQRLWEPFEACNRRAARLHDKRYSPRRILLYGNHEDRISRAVNQDPVLDGTIGLTDLGNEKYWPEIHPFLSPVDVDGVHYCHYFTSGLLGRPISSEHAAYQMLMKQHVSCTAGHSHLLDYCIRTKADGTKLHGLVAGWAGDYHAEFAGQANKMWWSGVIIKRNVKEGTYDPEFISLASLEARYGSLVPND